MRSFILTEENLDSLRLSEDQSNIIVVDRKACMLSRP